MTNIAFQAPPKAGSNYYNYKQFHNIIVIAISDVANTMVDPRKGSVLRERRKNIYNTFIISKKLANGTQGLSPSCKDQYPNTILPHRIVGNEAFPL